MKNTRWYILIKDQMDFMTFNSNIDMEKLKTFTDFIKKVREDNRFIKSGGAFIIEYKFIDEIINDYENYDISRDNFEDLAEHFFDKHYFEFLMFGDLEAIELTNNERELFKKLYWDIVHLTLDEHDIITIYSDQYSDSYGNEDSESLKIRPILQAYDTLVNICFDDLYGVDVIKKIDEHKEEIIAEYIEKSIVNEEVSKLWIAKKCGIKYKTFIDKLNRGSFTAYELIKLIDELNIDYYKMAAEVLGKGNKEMLVLKCSLCGSDLKMNKDEFTEGIVFYCKNPKCGASDEQEGCIPFESIGEENIKEI